MKVGDLVRWVLEDHELGVIVEVFPRTYGLSSVKAYKVFCIADNRFYSVYQREIEVIDESR